MSSLSDITLVIKVITDATPVDRLNSSISRMDRTSGQMGQTIGRLNRSISPLQNHFAGLSDKLGMAERKMDAVFRAGVHMQAMGRDLMGVGRDIAGFAQNIVETYAEYDFILRQASLALNTNVTWTKKLDKAIQDTAITLGKFKPTEVAAAFRIWGAATGEVIDSETKLARVTQTVKDIMMATAMVGGSLESNLQGVYGVTQQYNLGLDKAGYVTKVLSLLTERTALNFGDLASAFVYAGSYTGAIGVKFEDVAQALGVMADAGFRGSKAGRGLSMFFEGITAPSGPAKKALDKLAKSMGAVSWKKWIFPKGEFKGMRDLITKMSGALEKMTPVQRAAFLAQAGSNNAVRAAIPLINQQIALWDKQRKSGEKLTSILDEQKYSLKTADAFFSQMSTSFLESFDAVIGAFSNSFFPIIQMIAIQIMKFAGPVLDTAKAALKDLAAWMEANPAFTELVVKIGAIAAVVLTLSGAFLVALGTMAFFYSNIILLGAGLVPLVSMFATLALVFAGFAVKVATNAGGISDALLNLFNAFKRIFDIMMGGKDGAQVLKDVAGGINDIVNSGIKIVADAINAIADALNQLTPEQVGIIRDVGAALLAIVLLNRGLGLVAGALGGIVTSILGLGSITKLIGIGQKVILPFVGGFLALGGVVARVIGLIAAFVGGLTPVGWVIMGIIAAITAFVAAYQTNFMGFKDFIDGLIVWFQTELPGAINEAMATIGTIVGQILNPITEKLPRIIEFFQGILDSLAENWVPVLEHLAEVATGVFTNIQTVIGEVVAQVMEHVGPLVDELAKLGNVIYEFIGPAWNALVTIVGAVLGAVIKAVVDFVNWIAPYVQGFVDFFLRTFGALAEGVIRAVGNFISWVLDAIKAFVKLLNGIITTFTGLLTGNWDKVWEGLGTIVGAFVDAVTGFIRLVIDSITNIIRTGLGIVTGIFEGIFGLKPGSILATVGSFISTFITNIGKFITDVTTNIGKLPDKMISIGKDVVLGLWEGIKSMFNWMVNKITDFISDVIPGPIKDFLGIQSPSKLMAGIGTNIVDGLAIGISKNNAAYDAMLAQATAISSVGAELAAGTFSVAPVSLSTSSDATRTVNLNVDVTSGDGSVSGLDMSTLADLITGSDMVRALEHMASVD